MNPYVITVLVGSLLLVGCNGSDKKTSKSTGITTPTSTGITPLGTGTTTPQNAFGIEDTIPNGLGSDYTKHFNRYTKVIAPNGKPIHILAQNTISVNQIVRARGVLQHFLTDLPNSLYGSDKSAIANKMADNNAMLLLLNGKDDGENTASMLDGQPLYFEEMQTEGDSWYISQDYENHRDATYEEILHLVHDYGIGVDGNASFDGASPNFQAEIRAAQQNSLSNNLWGIGAENANWISELTQENSLSQEYLAAVIDAYYGLWGAWKESETHSMWGLYVAKDRASIVTQDPTGQTLLDNKFFHPYLTYNARIDQTFSGTFSLIFDASLPYTHHSQYLKDVTLTGENDSNVTVNELDNDITGNNGVNTVIFTGPSFEYSIENNGASVVVTDYQDDRDGTNTLKMIEKLQFSNSTTTL